MKNTQRILILYVIMLSLNCFNAVPSCYKTALQIICFLCDYFRSEQVVTNNQPAIHFLEKVRHIVLWKVQGPLYYIYGEQGIHLKRIVSQKASTSSRDKSWCHCQWPISLPQPYHCQPHSKGIVWTYAGSFPV